MLIVITLILEWLATGFLCFWLLAGLGVNGLLAEDPREIARIAGGLTKEEIEPCWGANA